MSGDELQDLVDALARRLGRSVAVDDPSIRLLAASRHFGDEDSVRVRAVLHREADRDVAEIVLGLGIDRYLGPQRLPAMPELGLKGRVCIPVRCAGHLLGYLWLIDDEVLTEEQIDESASVAEAAGLLLYRRELVQERRHARQEALLRDLLSADGWARVEADTGIRDENLLHAAQFVVVMCAEVVLDRDDDLDETDAALTAVSGKLRRHGSTMTLVQRSRLVLLQGWGREPTDESVRETAEHLASDVGRGVPARRVVVGIGAAQRGLRAAAVSYEQGRLAARTSQVLPGLGDVLPWSALGVYALLAKLAPDDLTAAAYPEPLLRLMDQKNARVLCSTLETYLDLAGDAQRTAEQLHVHRATLYQRLARIEEVSGLDLRDGGDRLTLHLGLKLARLTGVNPPAMVTHRQM